MMIPLNLHSRYSFLAFILININHVSSQTCRNDIRDFFYNVDFTGPLFDRAVYTVLDFSVSNSSHTPVFNFTVKSLTNETRPSFFNITQLISRALEPRSDSITVTSDNSKFVVVERSNGNYTLYTNTSRLNYFSPFNRYLFHLTARQTFSYGRQPVVSTAIVQINLKNDNVHKPVFTPINQIFHISELALANTDFGTVYAIDADNDVIKYSIRDTRFSINGSTGVLRLREAFSSPAPPYVDVTVRAIDDGSSSLSTPPLRHSSNAIIRVFVTAVNRNSPQFLWNLCGKNISLSENMTNGTTVKALTASDPDRGDNGLISISFPPEELRTTVSGLRNTAYSQFYLEQIDQTNTTRTAILRTKELFDYDAPGAIRVWNLYILATDQGNPQRQTFCNLRINLIDENDNSPEFLMPSWNYTIHIPSVPISNPQFLRIIAVDADSGQNSEIKYYIGTRAVPYFKIESDTGIITLHHNVDVISLNRSYFPIQFEVYAQDLGRPARFSRNNATVTIYYSNDPSPAQWTDQSFNDLEINISEKFYENYPNQCISQTGDFSGSISYEVTSRPPSLLTISSLFSDSKSFPFRDKFVERNGNRITTGILVTRGLHAEIQNQYLLYIRVLVNPPLTRLIRINLLDENDHGPTFDIRSMVSSVTAGETGYRRFAQIQAYDRDLNPDNNLILYDLNPVLTDPETKKYFHVELDGTVWTNTTFGGEINQTAYRLVITAYNDQPAWNFARNLSQDFQLDVQVISPNTNEPKFINLLSGETIFISEKTEIGTVIRNLTIIDADINAALNLGILSGNNRNAFLFTVLSNNTDDSSRTQFVAIAQLQVVGPLDYESQKSYTLVLFAFDANNLTTINVTIVLQAENTKAPLFKFMPGFSFYEYAVDENRTYPTLDEHKIRATNSDENDTQPIQYQIYDARRQLNLENLFLNEINGSVTLGIGPYGLLRDPPYGSSKYRFTVRATDANGTGASSYAEVIIHVNDVNNKGPIPTIFPCIPQGDGSSINIIFEDYDDPAASNTLPFQVEVVHPAGLVLIPTVSSNGNFILTYNGYLNRTSTKNFSVTFNASDKKSFSQLSNISLIVCDQLNAYPISDGSKSIKVVYVTGYQNALRNVDLGSVYVNDLNDWFRADRIYKIRSVTPEQSFSVSQGVLSTSDVLRPGFSTILIDVTKPGAGPSALATIYLDVESVDSEYVRKASTIRIGGEYPETILGQPLDKLRQSLASLLNINSNLIIILSIRSVFQSQIPYTLPKSLESQKAEALTDVIFYVPYLAKSDVERILNANIAQLHAVAVEPNPCANYKCPIDTQCRATRTIQPKPSMNDANLTSFVGINILDSADCVNVSSSEAAYSLSSLSSAAASRSSSSILGLSFEKGGYAIYASEKFSNRAPTRFSFDFVVRSVTQNALILVYGRDSLPINNSFRIAFEIYQSKLRFQFREQWFLANDIELNNSTWYHVECQLIHSTILLSINDCQYEIPVYNTMNTDDPTTMRLYLGGLPRNLYRSLLYVDTFSGCIRNVLSNDFYLNTTDRLSSANAVSSDCPCTVTDSCVDRRLSNIIVPWYTWLIMALVLLVLGTILALTLLVCIRKRQQLKALTGLYIDDTKDNIIDYRDTAGEEDHSTYNLRVLKKPVYVLADGNRIVNNNRSDYTEPRFARRPVLGDYIEEKLHDQVIPYANDTQLHYLYEGEGSIVSSLSSIESPRSSNESDYEFPQSFGPRVSKLADL